MAKTRQSAIVVPEIGKPVVKIIRDIPIPKDNEILVKVTSAGINPHDQKIRDWDLFGKGAPITLFNDVAGVVTLIGSKVKGVELGDHVFGYPDLELEPKGSQEYAVLIDGCFAKVPASISDDQAATFPVNLFAPAVAIFHADKFAFPSPFVKKLSKQDIDAAAQETLVVIGGGSSCGKFGVQLAKLAGIGKIVVTASLSNEAELKSYGATHVVDRHGSDAEVASRVRAIVGDDLTKVYDPINEDHTLALSLLSSSKKGAIVTLLTPGIPESTDGPKKDYTISQVFGIPQWQLELSTEVFGALPALIESGDLKPLDFKILEGGLNADNINRILDEHRDGKNPKKWHVNP